MTNLPNLPRVNLVSAPTPLHPAERLSAVLGTEIWFKRDDMTGLGLGGNKLRALEFLLAEALELGCDCLVTGAGPQSNWAMLAALCARRCGMDPYLVFYGARPRTSGNLQLDELIGAHIQFTGDNDRGSVDDGIHKLAAELRTAGRRPYLLPRGGATALGAVGYVRASQELADQLRTAKLVPAQLWLATGSCGTQSGLVAGARWLCSTYEVVGVTVSRPQAECAARVGALERNCSELLDLPLREACRPTVLDGYLEPGYGLPSAASQAAARLVARTESVFLDPVFGAKAMAALIDAARNDRLAGPVVFLVTGGAPTLFAESKEPR